LRYRAGIGYDKAMACTAGKKWRTWKLRLAIRKTIIVMIGRGTDLFYAASVIRLAWDA